MSSIDSESLKRPLRVSLALAAGALALGAGCGGSEKPMAEDQAGSGRGKTFVPSTDDGDDEDPDDIEVEGLKGRLEQHQIEAGLEPHRTGLARCYQRQVKKASYLGGVVTLKVVVDSKGAVGLAQISESTLGSWPVEKCVLEIARAMTFDPPKGGDRQADFTLPLDFSGGRGRVVWWEEERVEAHVSQKRAGLDECADKSGAARPSNVVVTIYLGNRGAVKSVGFASESPAGIEDAWADCAAEEVRSWALSDPLGKIAKTAFRYRP
jgi:TonB family protein